MKVCVSTDIGRRREKNQDYYFTSEEPVGILPNLFIIADGMGGHRAGDFASRQVVETMSAVAEETKEGEVEDVLRNCVERANEALCAYSATHEEVRGMGSTVVAAVLTDRTLHIANVGDSRLYLVGDDGIRQLTTDHSLVHEMLMRGEIDEETARVHPKRNIITRALGTADFVEVDLFTEELKKGEKILMCTDGLTNMVENDEIRSVLTGTDDLTENTERLIELANEHGGRDNITVIAIDPGFVR